MGMSQRNSGYERRPSDLYETPAPATRALTDNYRLRHRIYEPACGTGKMVAALEAAGHDVLAADINYHGYRFQYAEVDFLRTEALPEHHHVICTNPPYGVQNRLAVKFVEHALALTEPVRGQVAMLLTADFDHAKGRRHLFADHPAYAARIAIQDRIRWVEDSTGSPSQNHCWFVWDWERQSPAQCLYACSKVAA